MTIQTLKLGKQKFVLVPEKDFRRLQKKAGLSSDREKNESGEDRRDAMLLRRRLAEMRRTGEKPAPYNQARRELGLA